jgi:hypothetical protein
MHLMCCWFEMLKVDLRAGPTPRSVVDESEGVHFAQENGLAYFEVRVSELGGSVL